MDHEGKATKAASTGIPEGGRSSEVGVPVEPSHEDDRVDAPSGPSGPAKAAAPPHPPGPHPPNPHPSTPPAQPPAAAQGAAQGEAAPASPAKKKRKPKTPRKPKPNHLRKYRQELCLSQAELARRANLSALTIARIEKGFGCRMSTKRKILEALGLSLADRVKVFGEEE
ncbi:MAG: hypothetical protein CMN31_26695 [Sandaracinus sp.]|nr:hypothetical protein [Myxococcales bacterium]MAT29137.1 hypothetical protein [Sandaracinus sp.]MBJ74877.1 hypothetical protein [Sandaracinus sp.]